jgi:hypothetical protein
MEKEYNIQEKIVDAIQGKKIVINSCFGGFGLSEEAFELYLNKKGIKFYKKPNVSGSKFFTGGYYTVPPEQYDKVAEDGRKKDGDYREINSKNWYLSADDIARDDPILIEVITELGKKASGICADLRIIEIPGGVDWEISDYNGMEKVCEKHRSWN